jgi:hypothetical protein
VLANTRILDAPTRGRVNRQPTARFLIAIDAIAPTLLLPRAKEQHAKPDGPQLLRRYCSGAARHGLARP